MNVLALDTETWKIQPGLLAPPLVCVSWATAGDLGLYNAQDGLLFARECLEKVNRMELVLALLNAPYDMGVLAAADPDLLPLIFKAYEVGGIRDIKERQKLIDLSDGEMKFTRDADGEFVRQYYTLAFLARRHLGRELEKPSGACTSPYRHQCACGSWRLHYWELTNTPITDWPPDAVAYAVEDAVATLDIDAIQRNTTRSAVVDPFGNVTNELEQYRAGWALHLMSMWGLRTDGDAVAQLKSQLIKARDSVQEKLKYGFSLCSACDEPSRFGASLCEDCGAGGLTQHEITIGACRTCGTKNPIDAAKCTACKSKDLSTSILKFHTPGRGKNKGITKITKNTAEMKKLVVAGFQAQGREVPKTDSGDISIARETLEESKDPTLAVMASGLKDEKILTTYVPILESGITAPINPRYNTLVETGRTSSSEPNVQNQPRRPGLRECFIPRFGNYLCSIDYSQLELATLSQVCFDWFGYSEMRDAINAGRDLHLDLGAQILGITYEEAEARMKQAKRDKKTLTKAEWKANGDQAIMDARSLAKPGNFGLPGGLGVPSLIGFAKTAYGIVLTEKVATDLKAAWFARWGVMKPYFAKISQLVGRAGEGTYVQPRSGRVRGGTTYCAACNSGFQGLAADGAKLALWRVAKACYLAQPGDVLYGARPTAFIHDEIVAELPIETAHEAAYELTKIMIDAMKVFVPDVRVSAEPALMTRWRKDAETVLDANGRLIPWEPREEKRAA